MRARTFTARAAASVILAGALLVGTTGCTFISTQATLIQYDPSDGVGANLGSLSVRNVIGIINEDGHAISLMVTFVNSGSVPVNVSMQFESGGEKTTIKETIARGSVVTFGTTPEEEQIVVLNPTVAAGGLLPVYFQSGDHPGQELLVPVLDATGEYSELAPPEILR